MNETLKSKFDNAMDEWEMSNDCSQILSLLKPFADACCLDIEESDQKGSDCGAIEIQGRWASPESDIDSGDAIVFLLSWLNSIYENIEISALKGDYVIAAFKFKGVLDGPSVRSPSLFVGLLELTCLTDWKELQTPQQKEE